MREAAPIGDGCLHGRTHLGVLVHLVRVVVLLLVPQVARAALVVKDVLHIPATQRLNKWAESVRVNKEKLGERRGGEKAHSLASSGAASSSSSPAAAFVRRLFAGFFQCGDTRAGGLGWSSVLPREAVKAAAAAAGLPAARAPFATTGGGRSSASVWQGNDSGEIWWS